MAEPSARISEQSNASPPAPPAPQDYYALLTKIIDDVSRDHALLRKLVYALAWQNLKPEVIVAKPVPETQTNAESIVALEQALKLERAIERIEDEAVEQPHRHDDAPPIAIDTPRVAIDSPSIAADAPEAESALAPVFQPADDIGPAALAEPIAIPNVDPDLPGPAPKDLDAEHLAAQMAARRRAERDPDIEAVDASFEPPRAGGAVLTLPDPPPRSERRDVVQLERIPPWLDPSVRVSLHRVEYASIHDAPPPQRSNFVSFIQLVAASVLGVVLYIGISGWFYLGQQHAIGPAAAPPPTANAPAPAEPALASSQAPAVRPAPEPQPILPFPLPRTYGVYAGVPGQLFELEPLPIKVPDPRVLISAEIKKPSTATMPGENLSFVVFRRDLVNSAPQTATVRVVASVQRTTKFVDGKPTIAPLEGIWRIRAKSYEFKVSPLEGRSEMVVIQPNPGFVFPPGRYALVLNGFGYDFTVAGQAAAPEQCLEQVEAVNGAMLSECPKT